MEATARPKDRLYLTVEDPLGNVFKLDIGRPFTVARLKSAIQMEIGIPPALQKLTFNDKVVDDDTKALRYYGITLRCTGNIKVDSKHIALNIRNPNNPRETIVVEIPSYYSKIIEVKKAIMEQTGIPWKKQILMLDGQILLDFLVVKSYGIIHADDRIRLKVKADQVWTGGWFWNSVSSNKFSFFRAASVLIGFEAISPCYLNST